MATWSRRERVTRTVEWVVPASEPWGACWNQFVQAINQAMGELRADGKLGEFEEPSDGQIRVKVGDEEVIVFYEIKEQ
jgi:hypothetical protein